MPLTMISEATAERTILVDADLLVAVCESMRRLDAYRRPGPARRILLLMLANLCPHTGQVKLSRDDISKLLLLSPPEVSYALTTLERLGVVRRERHGRCVVAFFNPALAWSGRADARARWLGLPIARDRRTRTEDR